jgi:hypothetical protein
MKWAILYGIFIVFVLYVAVFSLYKANRQKEPLVNVISIQEQIDQIDSYIQNNIYSQIPRGIEDIYIDSFAFQEWNSSVSDNAFSFTCKSVPQTDGNGNIYATWHIATVLPKAPYGLPGPTGPIGPSGESGPMGFNGVQGPQGPGSYPTPLLMAQAIQSTYQPISAQMTPPLTIP